MNESEAIFSYSTAEEDCAGYIISYFTKVIQDTMHGPKAHDTFVNLVIYVL